MFNDLRAQIYELVSGIYLSDKKLCQYLGQSSEHITRKKSQIKADPFYVVSLEVLNEYKKNLELNFKNKSEDLIAIIQKYRNSNNLPKSIYGIHKYHPNLQINYFKDINTKEKAYWLGFLYADGYISKSNILTIVLEISQKDENLINRYANAIGFNLKYKKYIKRTNTLRIRFKNNKFAENLISHGFIVGQEKSNNIKLPELNSRELYLAFLLGYFDGDGKQGTTSIRTGSRIFLEQIKTKFQIEYQISTIRYKIKSGEIRKAYDFWLGGKIFNEMLDNYKLSLQRKRIRFNVYDESNRMIVMSFQSIMKKALKKGEIMTRNSKIFNKEDFSLYAWEFGKRNDFSYCLICDLCQRYKLEKPSKKEWVIK